MRNKKSVNRTKYSLKSLKRTHDRWTCIKNNCQNMSYHNLFNTFHGLSINLNNKTVWYPDSPTSSKSKPTKIIECSKTQSAEERILAASTRALEPEPLSSIPGECTTCRWEDKSILKSNRAWWTPDLTSSRWCWKLCLYFIFFYLLFGVIYLISSLSNVANNKNKLKFVTGSVLPPIIF